MKSLERLRTKKKRLRINLGGHALRAHGKTDVRVFCLVCCECFVWFVALRVRVFCLLVCFGTEAPEHLAGNRMMCGVRARLKDTAKRFQFSETISHGKCDEKTNDQS